MITAKSVDRKLVVDILTRSFIDNKSVNYLIKQDRSREARIKSLMEYSFDVCCLFGEVYLTEDKKGCALALKPEQKRATFNSILLDVKFIFSVLGFSRIQKTMKREAVIKKNHPEGLLYYLWFIGVAPSHQGQGIGSNLLNEIIQKGLTENRTICLETSTLKNIPWYQKHGFKIYRELDFGYKLYCMKRP